MKFSVRALAGGLLLLHAFLLPTTSQAQEMQVTLAGLAFSGDAASLEQRFPFSREYEKRLE